MAAMDFIDDARTSLEEALLTLTMTMKAFDDLAGESGGPAWLYLLRSQVDCVDLLSQNYMMSVHEHARPVLTGMSVALMST